MIAQRIQSILDRLNTQARVVGGTIGPRHIVVELETPVEVAPKSVFKHDETLAKALGVDQCRMHRRRDLILLEMPKPAPDRVNFSDIVESMPRRTAALGCDLYGRPMGLDISSPAVAHLLIAGTTGSGKTNLCKTIVLSLATTSTPRDIGFIFLDPKEEYASFGGLPHLIKPIESSFEEQLEYAVKLMEVKTKGPIVIIVVDELADIIMTTEGANDMLSRITQRGRSAGVHVIACTQKPTASAIGSLVKSNFPTRIVGRVTDARESSVACGLPRIGAEKLTGPGEFILTGPTEPKRFSAAYVENPDLIIKRLRGGRSSSRKHRPTETLLDKFIREKCVSEGSTKSSILYQKFVSHTGSNMTITKFGRLMSERFAKESRQDGNYYNVTAM